MRDMLDTHIAELGTSLRKEINIGLVIDGTVSNIFYV